MDLFCLTTVRVGRLSFSRSFKFIQMTYSPVLFLIFLFSSLLTIFFVFQVAIIKDFRLVSHTFGAVHPGFFCLILQFDTVDFHLGSHIF